MLMGRGPKLGNPHGMCICGGAGGATGIGGEGRTLGILSTAFDGAAGFETGGAAGAGTDCCART